MSGTVFIVAKKSDAPARAEEVFAEIYPGSLVVAVYEKPSQDGQVAIRVWARGPQSGESLTDEDSHMYRMSAYHRAAEFLAGNATAATLSGSWTVETGWDGIEVIGRIHDDGSGHPVATYGVEELSPTQPLSSLDADFGAAVGPHEADEPLPPFDKNRADASSPRTPARNRENDVDEPPEAEGAHSRFKKRR